MQIVETLARLPSNIARPLVAIGVFDGVHRGHQQILRQLVARARRQQGTALLMTFHPHPQQVISPGDAPRLLQTPRQKERILAQHGIEWLIRVPFTRRLSLLSPLAFGQKFLRNHGFREIHVGSNFRFGHRRSGDYQTLRRLGRQFGFEVRETPSYSLRGHRISSTLIRRQLLSGATSPARNLLGRAYEICGTVVRGTETGAKLGCPTANLKPDNELIPATGVYVTQTLAGNNWRPSITNIGFRPTLPSQRTQHPVVETHLLDYRGELYGQRLALKFFYRLRPERQFENIAALKSRIADDVARAKRYFERTRKLPRPGQI